MLYSLALIKPIRHTLLAIGNGEIIDDRGNSGSAFLCHFRTQSSKRYLPTSKREKPRIKPFETSGPETRSLLLNLKLIKDQRVPNAAQDPLAQSTIQDGTLWHKVAFADQPEDTNLYGAA